MTFVIIAGQLDLSVGTASALISVVGATVIVRTGSAVLGVTVCLLLGLLIGSVNGVVVTLLEVPSFIATLGTMIIASAVARALTNGGVVTGLPAAFSEVSTLRVADLPVVVWIAVMVFLVLHWAQRQTLFGYQVIAIGGNREAARLSGIAVGRITMLVFLISGLAAGLAGIALLIRVQSGQPNANGTLALEAIAAVVGGTSLSGGRGSIVRTLWGVLLIAVLRNGLEISGINEDYKNVVVGVVLIVAVSVDFLRGDWCGPAADRRCPVRMPPPKIRRPLCLNPAPPTVEAHTSAPRTLICKERHMATPGITSGRRRWPR